MGVYCEEEGNTSKYLQQDILVKFESLFESIRNSEPLVSLWRLVDEDQKPSMTMVIPHFEKANNGIEALCKPTMFQKCMVKLIPKYPT